MAAALLQCSLSATLRDEITNLLRLRILNPLHDQILALLDETLNLEGRAADFTPATPLLGALPELDSMAVAALLTAMEETFDITIGDDEVDGSAFETVGALTAFVEGKLG